jgi:hypothetical protein
VKAVIARPGLHLLYCCGANRLRGLRVGGQQYRPHGVRSSSHAARGRHAVRAVSNFAATEKREKGVEIVRLEPLEAVPSKHPNKIAHATAPDNICLRWLRGNVAQGSEDIWPAQNCRRYFG